LLLAFYIVSELRKQLGVLFLLLLPSEKLAIQSRPLNR
jgi:hypothetical protein